MKQIDVLKINGDDDIQIGLPMLTSIVLNFFLETSMVVHKGCIEKAKDVAGE